MMNDKVFDTLLEAGILIERRRRHDNHDNMTTRQQITLNFITTPVLV